MTGTTVRGAWASCWKTASPDGKLIAGYEGAWIYDKTQMPEEPFIYEPEPAPEESRYPGLELTDAEIKLMADLIFMEAQSEPFEGQQAVAEVIFNRLKSGNFQSSINSIIYAKDQFAAVKNLYLAKPTDTQYKAIERALNGPYVLPGGCGFLREIRREQEDMGDDRFSYLLLQLLGFSDRPKQLREVFHGSVRHRRPASLSGRTEAHGHFRRRMGWLHGQAQRRPVRHPAGGYHGSAGGFELGVGLVRRESGFCVDQRHSRTKDHSKGKSRLLVEHSGEIPEVL